MPDNETGKNGVKEVPSLPAEIISKRPQSIAARIRGLIKRVWEDLKPSLADSAKYPRPPSG